MLVVCSALVFAALPFFMAGGLAVQIKDDLGISEAALGLAVTIGFATGAVSAPFTGRIADRIGPKRSVYLGCALCVGALVGMAFATSAFGLGAYLCLAGVAIALTDPGLAILVSRSIPADRQGLAFGVKEASIPAAGLLAGVAVPTIALSAGWRWALTLGVLPLLVVLIFLPGVEVGPPPLTQPAPETSGRPKRRGLGLVVAAVAAALGVGAASGVGIFITDSAVAMGFEPAGAGLLLALGSLTGVVARIATGIRADRARGPQFNFIAVMLASGAAAMALGATEAPLLLVVATIGTFAGAWAWTGLYFLSLVDAFPDRPGAIAGIGTAGLGTGNALGPVLFGLAAGTWSFGTAWLAAGIVAGIAALLMAAVRKLL